uniref:Uncharacterized protein n=1 Tax=Urocitellus parryii TaxID=9999 RepID=A0A8D2IHX8_UROPR
MESEQGAIDSWHPMAARCARCDKPDPICLPYTLVRITEAEMRAYHRLLGSCVRLECRAQEGTWRVGRHLFYVCLVIYPHLSR